MHLTLTDPTARQPVTLRLSPDGGVTSFKGTFLSNMACAHTGHPALQIRLSGLSFSSVETGYMAAKSTDPAVRARFAALSDPYQAKRLGKAPARGGIVTLRPDWEAVKLPLMHAALRVKFRHAPYRALLLGTGDAHLSEGNTWGDTFWGVCGGRGENHLGKLLMLVRAEIRQGR